MKLPEWLEKLSQIKHAKVQGMVYALLLNIALVISATYLVPMYLYFLIMFGPVIISFTVLYVFGWRNGKKLAVAGICIFLMIGAVTGPLTLNIYYDTPQMEPASSTVLVNWVTRERNEDVVANGTYTGSSGWYRLENGTLNRYQGDAGDIFSFNVTYYSNDTSPPSINLGYWRKIYLQPHSVAMNPVNQSDTDYINGAEFYCELPLADEGVYDHWFAVMFTDSRASLNTTHRLGPLVGSKADNMPFYTLIGATSFTCSVGLLFIIVVLLYWWLNTAKEKRKTWDEALREHEDKADREDDEVQEPKPFTCDQCGAGVGVDDNFCPKCGERFDGIEEADAEPPEAEKKKYGVVKEVYLKETVREIVRIPCKHCGSLNENTNAKCTDCGAPMN